MNKSEGHVAFVPREREVRHVVEVGSTRAGMVAREQQAGCGTEFDLRLHPFPFRSVPKADVHDRCVGVGLWSERGIAGGNVDTWHVARLEIPCQRKVLSSASPTRCIKLVERVSAASSFGCITVEPAPIQAISVIFVRAGEKPFAVPNFDPRMVAGLVRPFGHASDARRHSHCAASVHQNDRQPGAGRFVLFNRFLGALVCAFALCIVMHVEALEEFPI